uniref:Pleckstrin homology and RhoGEF domain containing G6 n=2 Tax=Hippocampus comes TaxID=109280 RepID=A0A3Q3DKB5_HIPCM
MRTRQKVVSNFSTVTKGASTAAKPRAALKQVFLNQGVSDRNLTAEERSQLDVLKQELETFAVPISLKWRWREESHGSMLERNWTEIVNSHSIMSRMQRHQQEAMWEFVLTELNYINRLIVIKELVIAALVNLHLRGFLQEVTPERLFSNLPAILSAHQLFWQEVIYPMLQEVRLTGKPFNPMGLNAGCLQFRERFSPYCHYCAEEENSFEFARLQMESNPQFLTYVQWVETHPQCARMRIGDMQAKPHQRITKYALLLKAVLKTTQEPRVQRSLRGMLSSVNTFLESINDYLRLKDEEAALSLSAQRLEGYEMEGISEEIDKHVREICQFDLTCPIVGVGHGIVRKLLLEENLKVRGRKDS